TAGSKQTAPRGGGRLPRVTRFGIWAIGGGGRWKAPRTAPPADKSPVTAASAAACATLQTLEVACDWRFAAALSTSAGPIIQPTRQPVIAYVFATPLSTTH